MERNSAEQTRYTVDHDAAERFLATLEQPSEQAELGLRRLLDQPSALPDASRTPGRRAAEVNNS